MIATWRVECLIFLVEDSRLFGSGSSFGMKIGEDNFRQFHNAQNYVPNP